MGNSLSRLSVENGGEPRSVLEGLLVEEEKITLNGNAFGLTPVWFVILHALFQAQTRLPNFERRLLVLALVYLLDVDVDHSGLLRKSLFQPFQVPALPKEGGGQCIHFTGCFCGYGLLENHLLVGGLSQADAFNPLNVEIVGSQLPFRQEVNFFDDISFTAYHLPLWELLSLETQ